MYYKQLFFCKNSNKKQKMTPLLASPSDFTSSESSCTIFPKKNNKEKLSNLKSPYEYFSEISVCKMPRKLTVSDPLKHSKATF